MAKVTLSISKIIEYPGNYLVQISGTGFQSVANREVRWKLKGDDTFIDDNIIYPYGGGRVALDGTFYFSANAIGGNLNEDWGRDEIYAVVNVAGVDYNTNNVNGYY